MSAALHFASGVRLCNRPSALVMCNQTKTTLNGSPHFPGLKVYSHNICPHKYCPVNTNTQCTARHILFEISWRMLQDYLNSAPLTEVVIAGQYSSFFLSWRQPQCRRPCHCLSCRMMVVPSNHHKPKIIFLHI